MIYRLTERSHDRADLVRSSCYAQARETRWTWQHNWANRYRQWLTQRSENISDVILWVRFTPDILYNCHPLLVVIGKSVHWTWFPVFSAQEYTTLHLLLRMVTPRGESSSAGLYRLLWISALLLLFCSPSLLSKSVSLTGRIQTSKEFNLIIFLYCQNTPNFSCTFTAFTSCFSPILLIVVVILRGVSH